MADVSPRSSPLRDVWWGGTSATQQQKFHTDDVNQCLHNKFGSHGVPNANLFNFTFPLVDFGKVLCSSANELQQNLNASSREGYIPQILAVLLESHHIYNWPSVAESQTFLLVKRPSVAMSEEKRLLFAGYTLPPWYTLTHTSTSDTNEIMAESIRKLSNFNFQWTKTMHQNKLNNITFLKLRFSWAIDVVSYLQ